MCDNAAELIALGEPVKCRHTHKQTLISVIIKESQSIDFSSEDLFVREQEEHTASITVVLIWLPSTPPIQ